MDLNTVVGFMLGLGLMGFALVEGGLLSTFINAHGILIVVGGTIAATLINTPMPQLMEALKALRGIFFPDPLPREADLIGELVRMSERMHRDGISSLQAHVAVKGDGFLTFAVRAAQEKQDSQHIRRVLEDAIRQRELALAKAAAVFQTMAAIAPMFGLLGTIIGIVGVLKDIANPQSIGPSMAVAITTAFYGILLSALFCTPIAGKIRARIQEERRRRELILVGMLDVLGGAIPLEVERHLEAFAPKAE